MSSKKSPKSKKKLWIILGIVAVIAVLVVANLKSKSGPKGKDVDVTLAELDSLVQTVTASGKIQPKLDVNVSANVSGRIISLGADEGDIVKKGQLLVRIEDEAYKASLDQTIFAARSAEASRDEARSNLKRTRELHKNNLASDADLEAIQASVKRREAELDRARADHERVLDQYNKTRIYSAISGTVTRMNKEVGEMAIGAQFSEDVIMVVSRLDQMEVNVEVNENDVVLIELGDPVEIEVFAMPDTVFSGVVTEIAHSGIVRGQGTAEEVTNFNVTVEVTDYVPELRPGMSATVEIITETRDNTLVLPQEAVAVRTISDENRRADQARLHMNKPKKKDKDGEKSFNKDKKEDPVEVVFIVSNDTVWARPVTLGIYSDTHFEILSGIKEGETVVTGPFRLLSRELHSGMTVKHQPVKKDAAEAAKTDEQSLAETEN